MIYTSDPDKSQGYRIKIDKIGGWLLVKIRNSYTYSNYGKKTATRRQRQRLFFIE